MDPHRPISNSIVKGYSGEDTKRGAFWENNTMSKFWLNLQIKKGAIGYWGLFYFVSTVRSSNTNNFSKFL